MEQITLTMGATAILTHPPTLTTTIVMEASMLAKCIHQGGAWAMKCIQMGGVWAVGQHRIT